MDFLVTSPEGKQFQVTVPDGTSQEDALAFAQKQMAGGSGNSVAAKPPESTSLSRAQALTTGLTKGAVSSTVGLPGDLADLGQLGASKVFPGISPPTGTGFFPRSQEIYKKIEDNSPEAIREWLSHKPLDATEKYLEATGSGVTGLTNPLGLAGKFAQILPKGMALAGGVIGAAGEAGRTMLPSHPEAGALGAEAIPAGLLLYLAARKPQTVQAAQKYIQDIGPAGLAEAEANRAKATSITGLPTTLNQGTGTETALDGIVRELLRSPEGSEVRKVMEAQQKGVPDLLRNFTDSVTPGPLNVAAGNAVLDAGKKTFSEAKGRVNKFEAPAYARADAEMADPTAIAAAVQAAGARAGLPPTSRSGGAVENTAARIEALDNSQPAKTLTSSILGPDGKPIVLGTTPAVPAAVPVNQLAVFKQEASTAGRAASKKSADATTMNEQRGQFAAADAIKEGIAPPGSAREQADALHSVLMKMEMDPLNKGAMGRMFPEKARAGDTADIGQLAKRFDKITDPGDIQAVGTALTAQNPGALPLLVKQSFQNAASDALKRVEGRTSASAYTTFPNAVAGDAGSPLRASFEAKMKEVALARGEDPALVVKGASDFMDALYTLGRGHGGMGEVGSEFSRNSGKSAAGTILKSSTLVAPLRGLGQAIESAVHGNTYAKLADALTSADGVQKLKDIAQYGVWEARGQVAFRALAGQSALDQSSVAQ